MSAEELSIHGHRFVAILPHLSETATRDFTPTVKTWTNRGVLKKAGNDFIRTPALPKALPLPKVKVHHW